MVIYQIKNLSLLTGQQIEQISLILLQVQYKLHTLKKNPLTRYIYLYKSKQTSSFLFYLSIYNQKRMLKGLKTSKIVQSQQQQNQVAIKVNASDIKHKQVMKQQSQQEDIDKKIKNKLNKDELQSYKECFDMFLNGRSNQLIVKLQELIRKQRQKIQVKVDDQIKKGKFDYDFKYDDDQQKIKKQIKKRNRPIMSSNRLQQYCIYCPDNEDLQLLSASNYVYLALAKYKTLEQFFHFILAPVDHQQTTIGLNEDIITEINNYKKCLIQAFDQFDLQVIFFQQFSKMNSHIYIQCLAIPAKKAEDLPFFFKQALENIEGNWTTHKSIIKIEKQKGGLQKQIPKQINYFYIDFSNGFGYAHVIENQKFWKRQFCYEVIATALNIEIHRVKTTQPFSQEQIQKKRSNFNKIWKKYDWTQLI